MWKENLAQISCLWSSGRDSSLTSPPHLCLGESATIVTSKLLMNHMFVSWQPPIGWKHPEVVLGARTLRSKKNADATRVGQHVIVPYLSADKPLMVGRPNVGKAVGWQRARSEGVQGRASREFVYMQRIGSPPQRLEERTSLSEISSLTQNPQTCAAQKHLATRQRLHSWITVIGKSTVHRNSNCL